MPDGDGGRVKALTAAVGRVPSGLFVLTARRGGDETGMLASWVQQCSFDPVQVSVALRRGRTLAEWLTPGTAFTLNVLAKGQTDLISRFGKGFDPGQPAFDGLAVERPDGAAPVLANALAYLDCRVTDRFPAGDHDLVIGRVVGGRVQSADGHPAVHVRKHGSHY